MLVQMRGYPHALPAEEIALEMTPARCEPIQRMTQRSQRRKTERSNHEHRQGLIPHDQDQLPLQLVRHQLKKLWQQNQHQRRGRLLHGSEKVQALESLRDQGRADFQVLECV